MNIRRHIISILSAFLLLASYSSTLFALETLSEHYAKLNLPPLPKSIPREDRLVTEADPATGLLLVATHQLSNSIFAETVILLINHGMHGSVGLIINRPSEISLSSAFPEVSEFQQSGIKVYTGGPVNMHKVTALIRSNKPLSDTSHILDDIYSILNISTLRDLISKNMPLENVRIYSGYAGWWAGQLEREIMRGAWHVIEGESEAVFKYKPAGLWLNFQRQ